MGTLSGAGVVIISKAAYIPFASFPLVFHFLSQGGLMIFCCLFCCFPFDLGLEATYHFFPIPPGNLYDYPSCLTTFLSSFFSEGSFLLFPQMPPETERWKFSRLTYSPQNSNFHDPLTNIHYNPDPGSIKPFPPVDPFFFVQRSPDGPEAD